MIHSYSYKMGKKIIWKDFIPSQKRFFRYFIYIPISLLLLLIFYVYLSFFFLFFSLNFLYLIRKWNRIIMYFWYRNLLLNYTHHFLVFLHSFSLCIGITLCGEKTKFFCNNSNLHLRIYIDYYKYILREKKWNKRPTNKV